jgi:hypothetical protein
MKQPFLLVFCLLEMLPASLCNHTQLHTSRIISTHDFRNIWPPHIYAYGGIRTWVPSDCSSGQVHCTHRTHTNYPLRFFTAVRIISSYQYVVTIQDHIIHMIRGPSHKMFMFLVPNMDAFRTDSFFFSPRSNSIISGSWFHASCLNMYKYNISIISCSYLLFYRLFNNSYIKADYTVDKTR